MLEIQKIEANITPRHIFIGITAEHQNFEKGCRVLSSELMANSDNTQLFFEKRHEPGEPHWKEGGFECIDEYGARRAFHLDALIVAPNQKPLIMGMSRRGRKPNPNKEQPVIDPNKPKKGRGRPSIAPELRKSQPYIPNGGQRGRKSDPLKKAAREQKLEEMAELREKGLLRRGRPKKTN